MKRLTCALATLALVLCTYVPARAEYQGTLPNDQDWTLTITNTSNDRCAVRVYYVGRALDVIDVRTVPSQTASTQTLPAPGKRVKTIVIEVDPPTGGRSIASINGGAGLTIEGPARLVFEVL